MAFRCNDSQLLDRICLHGLAGSRDDTGDCYYGDDPVRRNDRHLCLRTLQGFRFPYGDCMGMRGNRGIEKLRLLLPVGHGADHCSCTARVDHNNFIEEDHLSPSHFGEQILFLDTQHEVFFRRSAGMSPIFLEHFVYCPF